MQNDSAKWILCSSKSHFLFSDVFMSIKYNKLRKNCVYAFLLYTLITYQYNPSESFKIISFCGAKGF